MFMEFLKDETGATTTEYGIIASFLCISLLTTVVALRGEFTAMLEVVADKVASAGD